MISAVLGETGEGLARLVRDGPIHKIGDHFGFSEEDIDRIEAATD